MNGLGLRARIMIPVALVLVAALGSLAYFTSVAMRVEFESFLETSIGTRAEATIQPEPLRVIGSALEAGGWEAATAAVAAWQEATAFDGAVVLLDVEGEPAAVVSGWFSIEDVRRIGSDTLRIEVDRGDQRAVMSLPAAGSALVDTSGARLGELILLPDGGPEPDREAPQVVGRVNRSAAVAMVGLAILAMLFAWWAVTRALAPVEQLRAGVQAVAGGDLGRRVPAARRDELGRLAEAFNSMAASLERGEELRRDMVADVAHELRTPLTALQCQLEALQDGLVTPTPGRIDSLHEETVMLGRLVGDLQLLAEAEAGTLPLHPEELEVRAVVEQALQAAGTVVEAAPPFELALADGLLVEADPVRAQQILRNLLSNALVHGSAPYGVRAAAEGDHVRFEVSDSGPGIPAAEQARVFERFVRLDGSRTRDTGGSGIGLTIVRRLVEAQGGRVGLDSGAGAGATFWFTLPRAARD